MGKEIKIGNYKIDKLLVDLYIDHFARKKDDISLWEHQRKTLHNAIFAFLDLDRFSEDGQKFSKELDKYCEPKIAKYDIVVASLKNLSRAETKKDIDISTMKLKIELAKKNSRELAGIRDKPVQKKGINHCRICGKNLGEGIPRINDHMAVVRGFDEIDSPICSDCSDNKPDEYNIAFRKQYWKH